MKSLLRAIIVSALIVGGLYIFGLVRNEQRGKEVKDMIKSAQQMAWEIQSSRR